jgi:hypothetical protein
LIVGSVGINADFVSVVEPELFAEPCPPAPQIGEPKFASLTIKPWFPRNEAADSELEKGSGLRRRLEQLESEPLPVRSQSYLAALLGRFRRRVPD